MFWHPEATIASVIWPNGSSLCPVCDAVGMVVDEGGLSYQQRVVLGESFVGFVLDEIVFGAKRPARSHLLLD